MSKHIVRALCLGGLACLAAATSCDDCVEYAPSQPAVEPEEDCLRVSVPSAPQGCFESDGTPLEWSTRVTVENACASVFRVVEDILSAHDENGAGPVVIAQGASGSFWIDNMAVGAIEGNAVHISFPAMLGDALITIRFAYAPVDPRR